MLWLRVGGGTGVGENFQCRFSCRKGNFTSDGNSALSPLPLPLGMVTTVRGAGPPTDHLPCTIITVSCTYSPVRHMTGNISSLCWLVSLVKYDFIDILESEGGKEKQKHQCVRETWIGCLLPVPRVGIKPKAQSCARTPYGILITHIFQQLSLSLGTLGNEIRKH